MKVTKRQLLQIIKEERAKLQEAFGVDEFNHFVDAIRAGIGYIEDWDVARQWEGMFGVAPRGEELSTILAKLDRLGMIRDYDEDYDDDMMEAAEPAKSAVRVTEAQLRRIVREAAGVLNEEEYDHYRDYKAGLISRAEYERALDRFRDDEEKLRPSDFAVTTHKAPRVDAARKQIRAALKAAGLTNIMRDYSEMVDYLTKGYKDHPDYGDYWDTAAGELLSSLQRSMD